MKTRVLIFLMLLAPMAWAQNTLDFQSVAPMSVGALDSDYGNHLQISALDENGVSEVPVLSEYYTPAPRRGPSRSPVLPPKDDEEEGWLPLGDCLLPLLLMLLGYALLQLRRRKQELCE